MQIDISNSRLAERDRYFREFSVWPVIPEFDTEGWLGNFLPEEMELAEDLLASFCFFNERMTDALLRAAIQNYFGQEHQGCQSSEKRLEDYFRETGFIVCEGEEPHPTDSGNLFARKLRDKFLVPQSNIMRPEAGLSRRTNFQRFVFVDDFSGSGNQFLSTWSRKHYVWR